MVSSWPIWNLKHDGFPQWFSRCTNTSQVHIAYVFAWRLPLWLWQQEYVTQCVISIRCYLPGMTLLFSTDPDSRSITHITLGSCGLVVRIQHHCSPITVSLGDLSEISCLSYILNFSFADWRDWNKCIWRSITHCVKTEEQKRPWRTFLRSLEKSDSHQGMEGY